MNHQSLFLGFIAGFSLAILLIFKVTMRPKVKKALRKLKLVPTNKAFVPRQKSVWDEVEEIV